MVSCIQLLYYGALHVLSVIKLWQCYDLGKQSGQTGRSGFEPFFLGVLLGSGFGQCVARFEYVTHLAGSHHEQCVLSQSEQVLKLMCQLDAP